MFRRRARKTTPRPQKNVPEDCYALARETLNQITAIGRPGPQTRTALHVARAQGLIPVDLY